MRHPHTVVTLITALVALVAQACHRPPAATPDVVYYNARIITVDRTNAVREAVAVRNGRILQVGTTAAIKRLAAPDTRMVDLGGKTVLPGFIDGHVHPSLAVRMIEKYVDGRINTTPSVAALLAKIAAQAAQTPANEWIIVAGSSSSQTRFTERRLPARAELDTAAPQQPVMFLNGSHEAVVNTAGVRVLGITRGTPRLKGAFIDLDEQGEPTGVVREGMSIFPDRLIPEQDLLRYYARSIPERWNAQGYTSVYAMTPLPEMAALKTVAKQGPTTLRYTVAVFTDPGGKFLPAAFDGLPFAPDVDRAWYRFGGIKVWVDSDVPMRGGAVKEPYAGPADGHGLLNVTQEELDTLARRVHRAGLPVLLHATGDLATEMALTSFERARQNEPGKTLQRIEHFGDFMLGPDDLARARQLGVAVNVQPAWITTLAHSTMENLGADRAQRAFAFRSMIDAGLQPGFGSDLTGIVLETFNPFLHIWAAVTRNSDVGPFVPAQAVSVTEAIEMMTLWAARAQGEDDIKGSIEAGKLADMVVISDDISTMPPEAIRSLRVLKTIVGGRVVFEAGT